MLPTVWFHFYTFIRWKVPSSIKKTTIKNENLFAFLICSLFWFWFVLIPFEQIFIICDTNICMSSLKAGEREVIFNYDFGKCEVAEGQWKNFTKNCEIKCRIFKLVRKVFSAWKLHQFKNSIEIPGEHFLSNPSYFVPQNS